MLLMLGGCGKGAGEENSAGPSEESTMETGTEASEESSGETTTVSLENSTPETVPEPSEASIPEPATEPTEESPAEPATEPSEESPAETVTEPSEESSAETATEPSEESPAEPVTEPSEGSAPEAGNGFVIVIDAGHQQHANSEKEPVGPGAQEMKAKVSGGTSGAASGLKEYELTLMVAEKLEAELLDRGYEVIMVRTSHDVDISNSQRAQVANDAEADAFIRIHANGSEDTSVHGAMTICQTASNPYNGELYQQSRDLSDYVLDELVAAAGCSKRRVWETDTMSGINWCRVPVTIVEMGFMTNPEEDVLMAGEEYQEKLAEGIANGIDKFLGKE